MQNDYNVLADSYQKTDTKPDKQYSILPTVLFLAGNLDGRIVADIGCGSGFFTRAFAESASRVIGMDDSSEQIALAKQNQPSNVEYQLGDALHMALPKADVINAPFVLGYLDSIEELKAFFARAYEALVIAGRFIAIIDVPSGDDLRKFGAQKILHGEGEGAKLDIILYNGNEEVCTLHATYHAPETVTKLLAEVGFNNVTWHKPIVSSQGMEAMPRGFWEGYIDNCELGYVTASKV